MNLKFSGKGLAFLSHYMADHDIRYYLNGVYLAPMPGGGPGVVGAATNGHVLGMWRDSEGHIDRPAILTITKGLVSACKKSDTVIENRDGRLTCVQYKPEKKGYGEELYVQPNSRKKPGDRVEAWEVEGRFPVLTKVAPKLQELTIGLTGAVNATYLGLISKSLPYNNKFGDGVLLRQVNKDGAILVLCDTIPEAVMVIMPMRDRDTPSSPWLENWRERHEMIDAVEKLPTPGKQPSDAAPPEGFIVNGQYFGHSGAPA